MVKIFPTSIDKLKQAKPETWYSEILVYRYLETLDDNWYVWHSVEWLGPKYSSPRETDFLIFNPEYGFLVLEVKGGEVNYENYEWKIVSHGGKVNKRDPVSQARGATFYFLRKYVELARKKTNKNDFVKFKSDGTNLFPGLFWYGLVFSTSNFKEIMIKKGLSILHLERYMIFEKNECDSQEEWMEKKKKGLISAGVISPIQNFLEILFSKRITPYFKKLTGKLKKNTTNLFLEMVNPKINASFLKDKILRRNIKDLEEINKEQDLILKLYADKNWCLFRGSAGTGKTFIAIKKAILLYKEGKKVLLLCFNRELKFFIRKIIEQQFKININKHSQKFLIINIHSFFKNIIRTHFDEKEEGLLKKALFSTPSDYIRVADFLNNMIKERGLKKEYLFDGLIVDEAQDINELLWPILPKFLMEREREKFIFYIFYDLEQKKYEKNITPEKFGLKKFDSFPLLRNLRNTEEIIKWIKDNTNHGKYERTSEVHGLQVTVFQVKKTVMDAIIDVAFTVIECYKINHLELDEMVIICDKQLKYIKDQDIVKKGKQENLITYLKLDLEGEGRLTLIEPNRNDKFAEIVFQNSLPNPVLFNGIGTFKGLEKNIVFAIFPNLNNPKFKEDIEFYESLLMDAYIAASRARVMLYVAMYNDIK